MIPDIDDLRSVVAPSSTRDGVRPLDVRYREKFSAGAPKGGAPRALGWFTVA
jgi:hypothetical protein